MADANFTLPLVGQSLILDVVRSALRTAALAQSDRAALDIAGVALRRVAELARSEVHHG